MNRLEAQPCPLHHSILPGERLRDSHVTDGQPVTHAENIQNSLSIFGWTRRNTGKNRVAIFKKAKLLYVGGPHHSKRWSLLRSPLGSSWECR